MYEDDFDFGFDARCRKFERWLIGSLTAICILGATYSITHYVKQKKFESNIKTLIELKNSQGVVDKKNVLKTLNKLKQMGIGEKIANSVYYTIYSSSGNALMVEADLLSSQNEETLQKIADTYEILCCLKDTNTTMKIDEWLRGDNTKYIVSYSKGEEYEAYTGYEHLSTALEKMETDLQKDYEKTMERLI